MYQGSVGPLLFNIYYFDLLFFLQDIDIYRCSDKTIPFDKTLESILDISTGNPELAIFLSENNFMKLNTDDKSLLLANRHTALFQGHFDISDVL